MKYQRLYLITGEVPLKGKGQGKGTGNDNSRTGREAPKAEQIYICALSLTSALDGMGDQRRLGRFTHGNEPVPILQEAEWTPGPVWMGTEKLATAGIRCPDRPARSELLYRLGYPGPQTVQTPL